MEKLVDTIDQAVNYLLPLLPIANSHTVNFIVDDCWTNVAPQNIQIEMEHLGYDQIMKNFWVDKSNSLYEFYEKAQRYVIENSDFYKNRIKTDNEIQVMTEQRNTFMSHKKLYEVEKASAVIADLAHVANSNLIIDIGSGKGYMPTTIVLNHQFCVLGIDFSQSNKDGAYRIFAKLEKSCKKTVKYPMGLFQSPGDEYVSREKTKPSIINMFKQRVERITEKTNIVEIINEEYPKLLNPQVFLTGLHTCGNLASHCLRMFVNNRHVIENALIIGCCYHLLDEEFCDNNNKFYKPIHGRTSEERLEETGFPMSSYLKNRRFTLGRDARMAGTQNPEKTFQCPELITATKPLFYRALLQKLLLINLGETSLPKSSIGRMAHKCESFVDYTKKALKKLNLDVNMSDTSIEEFAEEHITDWNKLNIFFLLKSSLSPVIETVILLDRLLYLYEQGITNSYVMKLFDPVISPRCYAIVSSTSTIGV